MGSTRERLDSRTAVTHEGACANNTNRAVQAYLEQLLQ